VNAPSLDRSCLSLASVRDDALPSCLSSPASLRALRVCGNALGRAFRTAFIACAVRCSITLPMLLLLLRLLLLLLLVMGTLGHPPCHRVPPAAVHSRPLRELRTWRRGWRDRRRRLFFRVWAAPDLPYPPTRRLSGVECPKACPIVCVGSQKNKPNH